MPPKLVTDADGWTSKAPRTPKGLTNSEASSTTLRIRSEKNLGVIECADVAAARKLQNAESFTYDNQTYPSRIYAMPPPDSCKGIVRNIEPNTSSADLMEGLRAPNYEIRSACMMGATATALVTFRGTYIPYEVIYRVGILRCVPHQPRAQFCTACLAIGHRLDVCPNSNVNRCKICGHTTTDSNSAHHCKPGCPNCGKDHAADDPDCETRKAADQAVRRAAYLKRLRHRQHANPEIHVQADTPSDSMDTTNTDNPTNSTAETALPAQEVDVDTQSPAPKRARCQATTSQTLEQRLEQFDAMIDAKITAALEEFMTRLMPKIESLIDTIITRKLDALLMPQLEIALQPITAQLDVCSSKLKRYDEAELTRSRR
ncbi:hypothetical protein HPB49_019729 [Dermacentor silvarum]|uniref:Uncharacterized protein n=1 Tax=Dermacentor silvarum TaxID=543639 RepID=A0ACB8CB49_DERSI|nr:hypothetical protein HPB49_019729 [Dermacentor silvarum]